MICINVHNVNQALAEGLRHLNHSGLKRDSRNGPVIVAKTPVMTTYEDPTARVLFSPLRDANPFFHVMEALWMLAGRNDLEWPMMFNKGFKNYSDDGHTLHGAYGYRWRQYFQFDQLPLIIDELKRSPTTRRAVLTMWDPAGDFNALDGKDIPCNTHAYFDMIDGRLNMTVCCRSNDIWWGAYGANAVHFSMLLEYMAAAVGRPVGVYRQMSNNYHIYPDNLPEVLNSFGNVVEYLDAKLEWFIGSARHKDLYTNESDPHQKRLPITEKHRSPRRVPMVQVSTEAFMADLSIFLFDADHAVERPQKFVEPFFATVAVPMYAAWQAFKEARHAEAFEYAGMIKAGDWNIACTEWLERRAQRRQHKLTYGEQDAG